MDGIWTEKTGSAVDNGFQSGTRVSEQNMLFTSAKQNAWSITSVPFLFIYLFSKTSFLAPANDLFLLTASPFSCLLEDLVFNHLHFFILYNFYLFEC